MAQDNSAQKTYWNDAAGPNWVAAQSNLDAMLEPLSAQAIARAQVGASERVLDLGCGCGATTLALAEVGATAIGIDLSEPMIARAKERLVHIDNAQVLVEDACTYRSDLPFDVLFSRFGVMFFADPYEAFNHLRGQLRESGRLVFICWQGPEHNPWMAIPGRAVAPFLKPQDPPPQPTDPGPFAFANPEYVLSILTQAGFSDIQLDSIEADLFLGATLDDVMAYQQFIGPVSRAIKELSGEDQAQAIQAARTAFAPLISEQGLSLPGRAWLVSARA